MKRNILSVTNQKHFSEISSIMWCFSEIERTSIFVSMLYEVTFRLFKIFVIMTDDDLFY